MTSELRIPVQVFEAMLAHCREGYPNESCGILAGKGNEVSEIYRMSNNEGSPVSYLMDPTEQFRVMKDIREKGLSMIAIFHSHPASRPYPSPKDVELAFYEDAAYVIVGLGGEEPEVKAFSIREQQIQEIGVVVEGT